jgi:type IX secretion system PorP/SprF family membrane protein
LKIKMKKRLLIIFCFIFFIFAKSWGQQESQFSQYMFNGLFLNPAVAGADAKADFFLLHRTQWAGYNGSFDGSGSPQTQVLSGHTPFSVLKNSGIGLHLLRDQLGPLTSLETHLSLAYHLQLNEGRSKLSFGVRGGIYVQTLDFDLFRAYDKDKDPLLNDKQGKVTQTKPDVGAGIFYTSEKFYVGISANRLIGSQVNFGIANLQNNLARNLYVTGGYTYELNQDIKLKPSAIVKLDLNSQAYSWEANVMGVYKEKFLGGLSFRQSDAATVMAGMYFGANSQWRAVYAFDYVVVAKAAKSATSHELSLFYSLPVNISNRPTQETPRYNH